MSRHCSKPGCSIPAAATLRYDYARRRAWLDPLTPEPDRASHDLCAGHADALGVPLGWSLHDRREHLTEVRALFAS